jgi:RNA polymerase sigma factor (sigma-70 family)
MIRLPTKVPPIPEGIDPREFLSRVEKWCAKLAGKFAPRTRITADEFYAELLVDVFVHLGDYDPDRGRPTTWVAWRAKSVFRRLTMRRGRVASAVQLSHLGRRSLNDDSDPAESLAVARPDSDACGGRLEREEDATEICAAVRAAVADLPRAQRQAIEMLHGIGRDLLRGHRAIEAAAGVTHQAVRQGLKGGREKLARDEALMEMAERHGLRPARVG